MNPYAAQNPYAAPQAPVMPAGYAPGVSPVRVEGNLLVAANGSGLPAVCLKCGSTHGIGWRDQKFRWVPRWAVLFGALIQAMVAKRSRFNVPLCPPCTARWKKWNLLAWLSWLPGVGLLLIGAVLSGVGADGAGGVAMMLGFLVVLAGLITALALRARAVVYPTRIDKTHTWLRGVHPNALQTMAAAAAQAAYAQPTAAAPGSYPQQPPPGYAYPPS